MAGGGRASRVPGARGLDRQLAAPRRRAILWLPLALFVVNWTISSALLSAFARVDIPYTVFREQVEAGNVVAITATGDRIEGRLEEPLTYPPDSGLSSLVFTTQRPSFADDDLMRLLLEQDVAVDARPPDLVPVWQQLVFGFGPTLLLVALLVWWARRATASPLGGLGGPGAPAPSVASSTPGMVGADLRNLVNEAALLAARRGAEAVHMTDFTAALEKIALGAERHIVMPPEERQRTAYHESGHALLSMLTPGTDPVRKVSVVPRGRALGVTLQSPETDRYGYTRTSCAAG